MDFDADPEIPENENGLYPVHVAALNGFEDFIEILAQRQANMNPRDRIGRTPLMCAAMKGHVEVIMMLLDNGANIRLSDNNGWTCKCSRAG